jgi:hypothetical protein
MTDIDYTTQAAELLGKHQTCGLSGDRMSCGMTIPKAHGDAEFWESHAAEVLAAAGLIPTHTEWGNRACFDHPAHDEQHARDVARRMDWPLLSRPAHDWKDATDD